jgi:gamma-glutamylaminecyclotransferase
VSLVEKRLCDKIKIMHYVFVYGTLKRGFGNHQAFLNKDPLMNATLHSYVLLSRGYSFPSITKGEGFVEGELYAVSDRELNQLDGLEGHPNFYQRTLVQVKGSTNDSTIDAWTYVIVDKKGWVPYGKTNWQRD